MKKNIKDHILNGGIIATYDRYYKLIEGVLYYADYSINNDWKQSRNDLEHILQCDSIVIV